MIAMGVRENSRERSEHPEKKRRSEHLEEVMPQERSGRMEKGKRKERAMKEERTDKSEGKTTVGKNRVARDDYLLQRVIQREAKVTGTEEVWPGLGEWLREVVSTQ